MQNLGDKQRVMWYFPKWPKGKFQASGRELGPAINFQFSVFLTFQSLAIFLLFANWMTTIVTELNAKVNPEKAEYIYFTELDIYF